MNTLTKTRSVLTFQGADEFYARYISDISDEEEGGSLRHVSYLRVDLWDEMGRPDTITLTVEPGDLLNA